MRAACLVATIAVLGAQGELPTLADRPVNDFAHVIDDAHAASDRRDAVVS